MGRLLRVCAGATTEDGVDIVVDVVAAAAAAAAGDSSVEVVGGVGLLKLLLRGTASSWPFGGFQRGHLLASVESSGTSTISLSLRSQRLTRKSQSETGTLTQHPLPRIGVASRL
jgi:hypothetical protein